MSPQKKKPKKRDERVELAGMKVLFASSTDDGTFTVQVQGLQSEEFLLETAMVAIDQALRGYCMGAFPDLDTEGKSFSAIAADIARLMDFEFSDPVPAGSKDTTRH